MIKKLEKLSADSRSGAELPIAIKDSAQQIWLAGLGAFAKAQEEGGKVFEALVKEGVNLQRKSQLDAEERINEAAERFTTLANSLSSRASGQWDKLENIFEDRVSRALERLGVPTAVASRELVERVEQLAQRVEQLAQQVQTLSARGSAGSDAQPAPVGRRDSRTAAAASPTTTRQAPSAAGAARAEEKKIPTEPPVKPSASRKTAAATAAADTRRKPVA